MPSMGRCQPTLGAIYWTRAAEAWLVTAEGYQFTALAGVRCVERTLADRPRGIRGLNRTEVPRTTSVCRPRCGSRPAGRP